MVQFGCCVQTTCPWNGSFIQSLVSGPHRASLCLQCLECHQRARARARAGAASVRSPNAAYHFAPTAQSFYFLECHPAQQIDGESSNDRPERLSLSICLCLSVFLCVTGRGGLGCHFKMQKQTNWSWEKRLMFNECLNTGNQEKKSTTKNSSELVTQKGVKNTVIK